METSGFGVAQQAVSPPKLRIAGVGKSFESRGRRLEVMRNVDLTVADREFMVIVGPSGCGKSTLLRMIQGLERLTTGRIELNGKTVNTPGPDRGFVFQHDNLYPWRTVLGNVIFGLELQRVPTRKARERAQEMIQLVRLEGFEGSYPGELSGGMRQRVNLARALAIDPAMLLMDEPFAALDAITRESMQEELLRIASVAGKTVLLVTHQIDEAVLLADRVAVLTGRPSRIIETLRIDLPRPRDLAIKRSSAFQEYVDRIWQKVAFSETAAA